MVDAKSSSHGILALCYYSTFEQNQDIQFIVYRGSCVFMITTFLKLVDLLIGSKFHCSILHDTIIANYDFPLESYAAPGLGISI